MRQAFAALLVLLSGVLAACGDDDGGSQPTLIVSAASSLTDAFEEIAAAFEAEHEGVEVQLNFGASSALTVQIVEGAPAHVFASANEAQMQAVVEAERAADLEVMARNRIVVIAPVASPVETFPDLARPGLRVVLAAPEVPVGAYAREALWAASKSGDATLGEDFAARALANVVSEEPNARAVLTRLELGEADAGIVYATDAKQTSANLRLIPVPDEFAPAAEYFIAAVTEDGETLGPAQDFVAFVLSDAGQAILARHGFQD